MKRLPHMKNVGIVISDFKGMLPDELSLRVGEKIEIISKNTQMSRNIGWWTARNSKGKIGICPAQCVKVLTNLSEANAVPVQSEYSLQVIGQVFRIDFKGEEVALEVANMTISDLLKAVEIEHNTVSGACTYPWMAPEVIRSSDFSMKSDIWR